jgi:23S rRNA (cytidine2498-2'-O)-methyltransferase
MPSFTLPNCDVLTTTPMEAAAIFTADPDFADLALAEWRQVGGPPQRLAPGVYLAAPRDDYWSTAVSWQQQPPIFIRHICPAQRPVKLTGQLTDLEQLATAVVTLGDLLDAGLPFSVQTRLLADNLAYKPFDANQRLAAAVQTISAAPLDVRNPQQVVSVVVAEHEGLSGFVGLSPAALNLSNWAGGVRRFAREPEQISRAEFKLLEALEWFGIQLPPRGVALDLGAAPGGWTRILRRHEQYVTAVDPADLHHSLQQDRNVRQLRLTAEEYLQRDPDQFDLIVNDMRLDGRDSARLMVAYARRLYPGGQALMTLKLPQAVDHALNILRRAYTIKGVRQFFHNRSEVTAYLQPTVSSAR